MGYHHIQKSFLPCFLATAHVIFISSIIATIIIIVTLDQDPLSFLSVFIHCGLWSIITLILPFHLKSLIIQETDNNELQISWDKGCGLKLKIKFTNIASYEVKYTKICHPVGATEYLGTMVCNANYCCPTCNCGCPECNNNIIVKIKLKEVQYFCCKPITAVRLSTDDLENFLHLLQENGIQNVNGDVLI